METRPDSGEADAAPRTYAKRARPVTPEDRQFVESVRQACLQADRGLGPEPDMATLRRFYEVLRGDRATVMQGASGRTSKRKAKQGAQVQGIALPEEPA